MRVFEGFGGIARRVTRPEEIGPALRWARREAARRELPVLVEVVTERVTDIAMGPEIDCIVEFEDVLDLPDPESTDAEDRPTVTS